jgi:hypothetical protein
MPVFSNSSSPKATQQKSFSPEKFSGSDIPKTIFVQDESAKTVSLGTSTSDPPGYERVARDSSTDPPEANTLPTELKGSSYSYTALLGHPVAGDSLVDYVNESDVSFPMRPKSFRRPPVSTRRGWVIIGLVVMIVLVVVAIPVGIGWGNLVTGQK